MKLDHHTEEKVTLAGRGLAIKAIK